MQSPRARFLSSLCIASMLLIATALMCSAQTASQPVASTGDAAPAQQSEVQQIQAVINDYKKAVDTLDLGVVRKIWSSAPEVTFIHPHGTEYGLDRIIENVYGKAMGSIQSGSCFRRRRGFTYTATPLGRSLPGHSMAR